MLFPATCHFGGRQDRKWTRNPQACMKYKIIIIIRASRRAFCFHLQEMKPSPRDSACRHHSGSTGPLVVNLARPQPQHKAVKSLILFWSHRAAQRIRTESSTCKVWLKHDVSLEKERPQGPRSVPRCCFHPYVAQIALLPLNSETAIIRVESPNNDSCPSSDTCFSPKIGIYTVLGGCPASHEELRLSRTGGFFIPWKDHLTSNDF